MRILVINPNTTAAMTSDIEAQARRYAQPDSEIEAISPRWGPASIEGHLEDELAAVATSVTLDDILHDNEERKRRPDPTARRKRR